MVQRLLFNGINAEAAGAPVREQGDLLVLAAADKAETTLSLSELAESGTQIALDPAVR